jgi:hypothetical protein
MQDSYASRMDEEDALLRQKARVEALATLAARWEADLAVKLNAGETVELRTMDGRRGTGMVMPASADEPAFIQVVDWDFGALSP